MVSFYLGLFITLWQFSLVLLFIANYFGFPLPNYSGSIHLYLIVGSLFLVLTIFLLRAYVTSKEGE